MQQRSFNRMGNLFFFLKMIVMTVVFLLFLQIKIGQNTLEEKVRVAINNSAVITPLEEVAAGGVKAIEQGWKKLSQLVGHKIKSSFSTENMPGNRSLGETLKRSQQYLKAQLQTAKRKTEQSKAFQQLKDQKDHLEDDLVEELKEEGFFIEEI